MKCIICMYNVHVYIFIYILFSYVLQHKEGNHTSKRNDYILGIATFSVVQLGFITEAVPRLFALKTVILIHPHTMQVIMFIHKGFQ